MNLFSDCFTENNGKWYCPVRVVGIIAVLVFLFLEVWQVCVKGRDFDAVAFGGAFVAIVGGLTGSISVKGRLLEGNPED